MALNLGLVKLAGATMRSKYSNNIEQYKIDIELILPALPQWLRDSMLLLKENKKS